MKNIAFQLSILIYMVLVGGFVCSCDRNRITINDDSGALSKTNAPVSVQIDLNKTLQKEAKEGRLGIRDLSSEYKTILPAQFEISEDGSNSKLLFIMPDGKPGIRKFELVDNKSPKHTEMKTSLDSRTGQVIIEEDGKRVLQYNYQTVYEKDVIRPVSKKGEELRFLKVTGIYLDKYFKAHAKLSKDTAVTTSIYSVPRSDYIHPLYGLEGEMLTNDWPDGGHPHHRGIFWAWPEVIYGTELGDIYALQRVFARPTGNIKFTSGTVYAEIDAENLWMWEGKEPIVNEKAEIRVYRATSNSRIIDLTIKLIALKDSVTIATRLTNSYGGLNLRMQTPEEQEISYFTDKKDAKPMRAWSDFNGIFEGNRSKSGLMVLQHHENPEYPGAWQEYPNLAWVQPTFPSPNTRYLLSKEVPLILQYRFIIHNGGKPGDDISAKSWDAYHATSTSPFTFEKTRH